MTRRAGPAPLCAALLAVGLGAVGAATAGPGANAPALEVRDSEGAVLARLALGAGGAFCLRWRHSVTGGAVADCFRVAGTGLVLERSFLHDFAAGLGEVPGRGVARPASGGGYWIEGIDEALPDGVRLRVGRAGVGHRIEAEGGALDLSGMAAGRRVVLRPAPGS